MAICWRATRSASRGLWPYPTMDTLVGGAIMGGSFRTTPLSSTKRLGRHRALEDALARLGDPLAATAVFDQAIWDGAGRTELVPPNPQRTWRRRAAPAGAGRCGRSHGAGAGGRDRCGLAGNLQDTVAGYDRAVLAGAGAELVPARTSGRMFGESRGSSKRVRLMPIAQPPFYAIALAAGITYTMGGIEIDAKARVIARDGAPFPGLLAAGSCTGGIEGGPLTAAMWAASSKPSRWDLIAAETISAKVAAGTPLSSREQPMTRFS